MADWLDEFDPLRATATTPSNGNSSSSSTGTRPLHIAVKDTHQRRQDSIMKPLHAADSLLSLSPTTSSGFVIENGPSSNLKTSLSDATTGRHHKPTRPGLASLFSDGVFASSPSLGSPPKREPTLRIIDGAPGFNTARDNHVFSTSPSPSNHEGSSSTIDVAPLSLTGFLPSFHPVLTLDLAEALRPHLPPRLRIATSWQLLYSLDLHGISLSTLYERVRLGMQGRGSSASCLLVVKDSDGHVFGAYMNEALKRSDSYYGSGECFLWKSQPFEPNDFRVGPSVRAYKWTGRNTYMVLSDDQFISLGGGEGKFGLWIDASFEKGSSAPCLTFDNEVLCRPFTPAPTSNVNMSRSLTTSVLAGREKKQAVKFEVNRVEVWRIGS